MNKKQSAYFYYTFNATKFGQHYWTRARNPLGIRFYVEGIY